MGVGCSRCHSDSAICMASRCNAVFSGDEVAEPAESEMDKLLAIENPSQDDLARIAELRDKPDDSLPHPDTSLAYLLGPNHTVTGVETPAPAAEAVAESPVKAVMKSLDTTPDVTDDWMKTLFKTTTGTKFDPNSSADRKRWAELKQFLSEVPESDKLSDVKLALKFYTKQAHWRDGPSAFR